MAAYRAIKTFLVVGLIVGVPGYARAQGQAGVGVVTTLVANSDYGQGLDCPATPDADHPICSTRGLALDAAGNLYVADDFMGRVQLIAPDGSITVAYTGALDFGPAGILVDTDGTLLVANHTGAASTYRDSVMRLTGS